MARSSILLPQWLQLYVQLLQMRDPSPRRSRLASESRSVPHVLQRKQSMCHLLPAVHCQRMGCKVAAAVVVVVVAGAVAGARVNWRGVCTYRVRTPCPLQGSNNAVSRSKEMGAEHSYLSTPLARIHHIVLIAVLVQQRLRVAARRVHDGQAPSVRARWWREEVVVEAEM